MDERKQRLQVFEFAVVLSGLPRLAVARAARSCLCCHTAGGVCHPLKARSRLDETAEGLNCKRTAAVIKVQGKV